MASATQYQIKCYLATKYDKDSNGFTCEVIVVKYSQAFIRISNRVIERGYL